MNKENNNKQTVDFVSFKKGFVSPNMPIITLYQNSKEFNFLIDTGSNRNMLNSETIEDLEYQLLNTDNNAVQGIDGGINKVQECKATFSYGDKKFCYNYLISNLKAVFDGIKDEHGIKLHGMIGSEFLHDQQYVLDFQHLIAYSKI